MTNTDEEYYMKQLTENKNQPEVDYIMLVYQFLQSITTEELRDSSEALLHLRMEHTISPAQNPDFTTINKVALFESALKRIRNKDESDSIPLIMYIIQALQKYGQTVDSHYGPRHYKPLIVPAFASISPFTNTAAYNMKMLNLQQSLYAANKEHTVHTGERVRTINGFYVKNNESVSSQLQNQERILHNIRLNANDPTKMVKYKVTPNSNTYDWNT